MRTLGSCKPDRHHPDSVPHGSSTSSRGSTAASRSSCRPSFTKRKSSNTRRARCQGGSERRIRLLIVLGQSAQGWERPSAALLFGASAYSWQGQVRAQADGTNNHGSNNNAKALFSRRRQHLPLALVFRALPQQARPCGAAAAAYGRSQQARHSRAVRAPLLDW